MGRFSVRCGTRTGTGFSRPPRRLWERAGDGGPACCRPGLLIVHDLSPADLPQGFWGEVRAWASGGAAAGHPRQETLAYDPLDSIPNSRHYE
jgi:hypothetical protein